MKTLHFGKLLDQNSLSINSDFQLFGGQAEDYSYGDEMGTTGTGAKSNSTMLIIGGLVLCCILIMSSSCSSSIAYYMKDKADKEEEAKK